MLSSALLDNRKWAGKEEPEKQERRELNGNAAPGVGPTSTGKKTRPEKTEENNNNHNNRNHSTGDPERPGHRGEEVRSPGTRGEEVRSPGTRGEEVRSPGTRGEEVRSSGTRRHEENGNDDDNRNFKPETDTNCNEPSLPCRCCREHSPPREPGKKTPPETILDEREGQGKPGSLWPPPSCAEPPQSPLEFTLSSSGSSSSSSISSCSDFESDSNPEFPADSRRDAVVGEGGGVLSPDSRRQPDIVPLEQGMEPRCLEEKEKKETETETQQEGLSEVFIPCCSPDEGYPSGHCSRSSSFPELGEGEEEELPDSLAGSPDEDNDGNNQPFSGMSSSGASPCSEPESRDGSKPARSSPPNQSFSFYSSPGPLSRIHGLPGKAPNNIPKLEKVDDPSSQTGWTADRKQAGRIPDIPDVIIKKNKEVPDPDSRDTDPIPGKISDTPGNAALKGKEEDIPAGSSGQRWDSWADVLGGKEGGGKEGRRPLVLDLGGPGYVDRLLGQRSPLLDSRGIPEPQKNVTSFHELARRRRRSGGSANHSAAGGDRERSDWLMVFSPDTELPPRPFGNGNQRAEAEEEEEEGEDRRSSPQKGGSQGGSNVTTFKELRLRNKQNQQRQNWGSCSSDEGAVQMEPEEPPPFPSAWDPFPEEAGGSEPSAAAQPPPPAISFYFQTPSQPPLARRHSRPALQPIAEGAAEDEPRPLGIPPGDGEGERGTADGGRGRESHSAAVSAPPSPYFPLPDQTHALLLPPVQYHYRHQQQHLLFHHPSTRRSQLLSSPDESTLPASGPWLQYLSGQPGGALLFTDLLSPPTPPRLSPIGAYSPPVRAGLPPPCTDLPSLCCPFFPRSRTLPSLRACPGGPQDGGQGSGGRVPAAASHTGRACEQLVRSLSFTGPLQVGGTWMAGSSRTPLGDQELPLLCLQQKSALVNAVSSAVEEILSHFSSSRTLVQKAQSGDSRLNPSLARLVLQALCPALRSLLSDGLKPYQSDLIVGRRRNSPWGLVEASTRPGPSTQGLHLLSSRLCQLPELRNANKRFNAFVFGLLNLKLLDHWLSHLQSSQDMLSAYYSPASFLRLTSCQPLFEELLLLLQPLSLLTFHLDLLFEHHHLLPANQDGHRASSANQIPRGSALANRGPDGKGTANQDSPGLANGSEHTDQGPKPGTANPAPGGGAGPTNQKPASRKEAGSSGPANQSVLFPVEWELGGAPPSAGRPLSQQAGQALQSGWKQIVQWGGGLGQNWAGSDRASRIRAGEGEVSWWDKLSQNPWVSLSPTQTQNWGKDPRSCTETQSGTSPDTRGTDAEAPPPRPDGSGAGQRAPVGSEVKGAQFWMLGRLFGASLGDSKPATQEQKLRRPSSWLSPSASVLRAIRTGAAAQRGGERSGPETSPKQTDTQNPGLRAVRTLCDYQGSGAELSFRKGEELPLVGAVDEEWIRCRQGDREGLVPIGFASLIM
ncbi:AP-4 complex accessory subunit RUSC1-like isoform X3 [Acipenser ruthenus]|uniref:AP-4 complex accessory subunit RUSC1-like isoform X3 n=1 Tax=Acipenser ruthenus TaxID=7906 RepID=UPI00274272B2|nr:AP-4 complex accessory subunit RUSC1-like isoform X3 [Acipenser ruthenus]